MSYNFLIVDDSTTVRKVIEKTLRLSGLEIDTVYHAANGIDGLAMLADHWVDLIFADINMPQMNGVEMIERIKADSLLAEIPIVIVSTEGSETRIEYLQSIGIRGYLRKPFTPDQFRDLVRDLLGVQSHACPE